MNINININMTCLFVCKQIQTHTQNYRPENISKNTFVNNNNFFVRTKTSNNTKQIQNAIVRYRPDRPEK